MLTTALAPITALYGQDLSRVSFESRPIFVRQVQAAFYAVLQAAAPSILQNRAGIALDGGVCHDAMQCVCAPDIADFAAPVHGVPMHWHAAMLVYVTWWRHENYCTPLAVLIKGLEATRRQALDTQATATASAFQQELAGAVLLAVSFALEIAQQCLDDDSGGNRWLALEVIERHLFKLLKSEAAA